MLSRKTRLLRTVPCLLSPVSRIVHFSRLLFLSFPSFSPYIAPPLYGVCFPPLFRHSFLRLTRLRLLRDVLHPFFLFSRRFTWLASLRGRFQTRCLIVTGLGCTVEGVTRYSQSFFLSSPFFLVFTGKFRREENLDARAFESVALESWEI